MDAWRIALHSRPSLWCLIPGLALVYLLVGIVVSHSGLHTQIIPFWLPAGVALAAGRHFGYRILPGRAWAA